MTVYTIKSSHTGEVMGRVQDDPPKALEGDVAKAFLKDLQEEGGNFDGVMAHWEGNLDFVPEDQKVEKSMYRVTSEQTQEPTGHVLVEDGLLTGYVGENPPMGYEEGRDFTDWQNEQRGLVLEKVEDEVEQETVESQAHMVGEAVGAALVASGLISKTDEDKRMVFGWAYVTHDREGNVVVDKSGDFIDDVEEIEKTAYFFVVKSRAGDMDHTNLKSAVMVESMVFTPEKIEKMGIPPGILPTGWWVGFHFEKDEDWAIAKTRTAFSIHGRGTRKSVD